MSKQEANGESEISLAEVTDVLRRRWLRFLMGGLLGVLITSLAVARMKPAYGANARVLVGTATPSANLLANLPLDIPSLSGESSHVKAEIEVFRSRPVLSAVADEPGLHEVSPSAGLGLTKRVDDLDVQELWRRVARKLNGTPDPTGSLEIDVPEWKNRNTLKLAITLSFPSDVSAGDNVVDVSIDEWFGAHARVSFQPGVPFVFEGVSMALRPAGDLSGRHFLLTLTRLPKVLEELMTDMAVGEVDRGSNVIGVGFLDPDAARAAELANAVVRSYLAHNRERVANRAGRSVEFLQQELERVREDLSSAEERLRQFGEEAGPIAIPDTASALVEQLVLVDVERARANLGLRTVRKLFEDIKGRRITPAEIAGIETTFSLGNSELQETRTLSELVTERTILAQTYTEEWPAVVTLRKRIDERISALEIGLATEITRREAYTSDLDSILQRNNDQLSGLPQTQLDLVRHRRDVQAFTQIFLFLLTQLQEAKVTENTAVPTVEVIDWAVPALESQTPSLILILGLGGIVGLFLGAGSCFLKELSTRPVTHSLWLESLLEIPALRLNHRTLNRRPSFTENSRAIDSLRLLSIELRRAAVDGGPHSFAVVSTTEKEGRSFVAAHLAVGLARGDRRVLLIDGDRSHHNQQHWFGGSESHGLGDVLRGTKELTDVIQTTSVNGVDLLLFTDADATDYLGTPAAELVFRSMHERYDYVVMDVPALMDNADAAALASQAQSTVFTCRRARPSKPMVIDALGRLRRAGGRCESLVFIA